MSARQRALMRGQGGGPQTRPAMQTGRLEAFSDGVIAIIITIMVLELKVPHGSDLAALRGLAPVFLSYVLSFLYVGIYWNNHHHLLHLAEHLNGGVLWGNLHLLFWLSLLPFITGWMGENHFDSLPTALYGFDLLMCALAFLLVQRRIVACNGGRESRLARALGRDLAGKISPALYALAIPLAFIRPWIADTVYVVVAGLWFIPDPRIERALTE